MKNIKYRIPVECTRCGKHAFWYCQVDDNEIHEHKGPVRGEEYGVPASQQCACPKWGRGEGWTRAGENQLCLNIQDRDSQDIYEGDEVEYSDHGDEGRLVVDSFIEDAYTLWNVPQDTIKVVGSTWLGPTDTQSGGAA
jgi:hypothetical protein